MRNNNINRVKIITTISTENIEEFRSSICEVGSCVLCSTVYIVLVKIYLMKISKDFQKMYKVKEK